MLDDVNFAVANSSGGTTGPQKQHKHKRQAYGPVDNYNALIECGELDDDPYQRTIVNSLQRLHDKLDGYKPAEVGFFLKVICEIFCEFTCNLSHTE